MVRQLSEAERYELLRQRLETIAATVCGGNVDLEQAKPYGVRYDDHQLLRASFVPGEVVTMYKIVDGSGMEGAIFCMRDEHCQRCVHVERHGASEIDIYVRGF